MGFCGRADVGSKVRSAQGAGSDGCLSGSHPGHFSAEAMSSARKVRRGSGGLDIGTPYKSGGSVPCLTNGTLQQDVHNSDRERAILPDRLRGIARPVISNLGIRFRPSGCMTEPFADDRRTGHEPKLLRWLGLPITWTGGVPFQAVGINIMRFLRRPLFWLTCLRPTGLCLPAGEGNWLRNYGITKV